MARQNTIAQAQNLCCFMFRFPPFPDASAGAVSAGQTVAAGDAIGVVGRTAVLELGEDSHLHFAVFLDGAPVDPNEFLA